MSTTGARIHPHAAAQAPSRTTYVPGIVCGTTIPHESDCGDDREHSGSGVDARSTVLVTAEPVSETSCRHIETRIHTTQRPRELTVGQHATTLGTSREPVYTQLKDHES